MTWLFLTPKAVLRWIQPIGWMIYPAAHIAWVMAKGAVVHHWQYAFANVDKFGYPHVLSVAAGFITAFYGAGLLAVAAERFGGRLVAARAAA